MSQNIYNIRLYLVINVITEITKAVHSRELFWSNFIMEKFIE